MHKTEDIIKQIQKFNIPKGSVVTIHTSLKAIGKVEGGAEALLDALIKYFTEDGGLLCIPTHTWDGFVCDRRKAVSCIGVLPSIAAGHPDAVRSYHPSHSVAVFGDRHKAEEFAKCDDNTDTPAHPDGCYGRLYDMDGYILLIGVGQTKNTFIHCIEEMLEVPNRLTQETSERTIIHKDGREEKKYIKSFDERILDVSVNFGKFEKAFRYHGCITDGFIGNAPTQMCRARQIKEVVELIYNRNNFEELLADDAPLKEELYK